MMRRFNSFRKGHSTAFAVSEILLTVTTATTVVGTILTALTIYMSVADEEKAIVTSTGPASILPAEELTMDASLFHLEFQEIVHQADLVYVIGGRRFLPGSSDHANFVFDPSLSSGDLSDLAVLRQLSLHPNRALSSYVVTRLLQDSLPAAFVGSDESPYRQYEFTVIAANARLELSAFITQRVRAEGSWVVLEQSVKRAHGGAWSEGSSYRLAVDQTVFSAKAPLLSLGAEHYWVRHDRVDPQAISIASNSVWDRHEEGVCKIEFPDPMWNLALQPESTALASKYTYYLPVAR